MKKLITMELLKEETVECGQINENLTLQLELKKMELEMKREEMKMQREKEEKEREMKIREKEMEMKEKEIQLQSELQREKQEKEFELERLKIERGVHAQQNTGLEHPPRFDAAKNIRLMPIFYQKMSTNIFRNLKRSLKI